MPLALYVVRTSKHGSRHVEVLLCSMNMTSQSQEVEVGDLRFSSDTVTSTFSDGWSIYDLEKDVTLGG